MLTLKLVYITVFSGFIIFLGGFSLQVFVLHTKDSVLDSLTWKDRILSTVKNKLLKDLRRVITDGSDGPPDYGNFSPSNMIDSAESKPDYSNFSPSNNIDASESKPDYSNFSPSNNIDASESKPDYSNFSPSNNIDASESKPDHSNFSPSNNIDASESKPDYSNFSPSNNIDASESKPDYSNFSPSNNIDASESNPDYSNFSPSNNIDTSESKPDYSNFSPSNNIDQIENKAQVTSTTKPITVSTRSPTQVPHVSSSTTSSENTNNQLITTKNSLFNENYMDATPITHKRRYNSYHLPAVYETIKHTTFPTQSPILDYLNSGKHLPLVLLTCNRPEMLDQTLQSLLQVTNINLENIIISQDGDMTEISTITNKYKIKLFQNIHSRYLRVDESSPIAIHYKYSLSKAFDYFTTAPAVIIIEDDLLFSPDFLDYFEHIAPILDIDKSVLAVSAWNDNGFKEHVHDPYTLYRTNFFPGLGWLLSRNLYKTELETQWPIQHWDHWLRSPQITKGREIVYPEVPRTYHNGIKGTFMNLDTHKKYFQDIGYNQDKSLKWPVGYTWYNPARSITSTSIQESAGINEVAVTEVHTQRRLFTEQKLDPSKFQNNNNRHTIKTPVYAEVMEKVYETRIKEMMSTCTHVNSVNEISTNTTDVDPDSPHNPPPFEPIANYFHLWHEHKRGAHHGVHEFYWNNHQSYIVLINIHPNTRNNYKANMPSTVNVLPPHVFRHHQHTHHHHHHRHHHRQ